MIDLMKKNGVMAVFAVWLLLVMYSWEENVALNAGQASTYRYGRQDLMPKWMPERWMSKFLEEIGFGASEPLFARGLGELRSSLDSTGWIEAVKQIRRVYSGDMTMSVEVRRPVCVVENGAELRYLAADLTELNTFAAEPEKLKQGSIPVVDVSLVAELRHEYRERCLAELLAFIDEWCGYPKLLEAFVLKRIEMVPAGNGKECQLRLIVWDKRFGQDVDLWWGVHREYNALEDRRSREKWSDLHSALEQNRRFSVLELRYRPPQSSY